MNHTSTVIQLICNGNNNPRSRFTLQVFVLSLQGLQMINRLLIGVLQFEELSAQTPGFFLRALQFTLRLLILLLPFRQDLE